MEVVDPAMTVKALGHQWYWSTLCDLLEQHSDNVNLLSASVRKPGGFFPMSLLQVLDLY